MRTKTLGNMLCEDHLRLIRYAIPSVISVVRVLLAVTIVLLVSRGTSWPVIITVVGIPVVFLLDAADGVIARRLNSESLLGSFIDIFADRLVELIFLPFFAHLGLLPVWFLLAFYGRIALTDFFRMCAFKMKRVSATGIELRQPWRFFVLSRTSRSLYAAVKGVLVGVLLLAVGRGERAPGLLEYAVMISVLGVSILRAIPIILTYVPKVPSLIRERLRSDKPSAVQDFATRTTRVASGAPLALDVCVVVVILVQLVSR
jgi:phosphatidylglycerophosphate synthase